MPAQVGPDLKKYMDKKLSIKLNGNRNVTGLLRGFDQFMNLVLDETVEQVSASEKNNIGMVVIRGNSIVMMEALEKLWGEAPDERKAPLIEEAPDTLEYSHGFPQGKP